MKRNEHDIAIPFHCNTCGKDYTIEGYVHWFGNDEVRIIPAEGGGDMCPNDRGVTVDSSGAFGGGSMLVPAHDANWIGDTT